MDPGNIIVIGLSHISNLPILTIQRQNEKSILNRNLVSSERYNTLTDKENFRSMCFLNTSIPDS